MPQGSPYPAGQPRFPRTVSLPHPRPFAPAHPVALPGDSRAGVTVPGGLLAHPAPNHGPAHLAQPDLAQGARRLTSAPARPSRRGRPAALAATPLQAAANTARPQTSAPRRGQPCSPATDPSEDGAPQHPLLQTAEQMLIFPMREPRHKSILRRGGGCRQRRAKAHPSVATQP